jgi:hypothetical protein
MGNPGRLLRDAPPTGSLAPLRTLAGTNDRAVDYRHEPTPGLPVAIDLTAEPKHLRVVLCALDPLIDEPNFGVWICEPHAGLLSR